MYRFSRTSISQSDNHIDVTKGKADDLEESEKGKDDDLIIEDNTVYEIDRDCYERMKKQKKR